MMFVTEQRQGATEMVSASESQRWNELVGRAFLRDIYHGWRFHHLAEAHTRETARLIHFQRGEFSISLPLLLRQIDESLLSKTDIVQGLRQSL